MYLELKPLEALRHTELPQVAAPWYAINWLKRARSSYCRIGGFHNVWETCIQDTDPRRDHWNHCTHGFEHLCAKIDEGDWVVILDPSWPPLAPAYAQVNGQWQLTHHVAQPRLRQRLESQVQTIQRQQREQEVLQSRNTPPAPKEIEPAVGPGNRAMTLSSGSQYVTKPIVDSPGAEPAGGPGSSKKSPTPPATAKDLATPKSPADAPKQVNLSAMQSDFDKQWSNSFPGGKSQEHGGTIISDSAGSAGDLKLGNSGGGTSGSFSPNLSVGSGEKVEGIFHTHPYDATEGGHTGVSLSGGDAGYLINGKQNVILAQSGDEQFMYMRTATTPASVNGAALNNTQNARIGELMDKGSSFSDASKTAAQETANTHGLAYYEGTGGVFNRIAP